MTEKTEGAAPLGAAPVTRCGKYLNGFENTKEEHAKEEWHRVRRAEPRGMRTERGRLSGKERCEMREECRDCLRLRHAGEGTAGGAQMPATAEDGGDTCHIRTGGA